MKKFILKAFVFLIPVTVVFCITAVFYSTEKGDLLRLGYIADVYNYDTEEIFKDQLRRKTYFTKLSEIDLTQPYNFNILNIGDSFSNLNGYSYLNYLAENNDISVLNYDRSFQRGISPIKILSSLLNGNVLDNIKLDYIILETVEREMVLSSFNLDREKQISQDSLQFIIKQVTQNKKNEIKNADVLFSGRIKNFLKNNYNYNFDDNAFNSQAYKVKTSKELFSTNNKELLFYFKDVENLKINNNRDNIYKLNEELNILSQKLKKRNIKLIVLCPPDKYNFYYQYIAEKLEYTKPLFFDYFNAIKNKDYLYINSKKILDAHLSNKKDIYFFDDTHWSPFAAQIIAKEISACIN